LQPQISSITEEEHLTVSRRHTFWQELYFVFLEFGATTMNCIIAFQKLYDKISYITFVFFDISRASDV